MMRQFVPGLLLAILLAACSSPPAPAKPSLVGRWEPVTATLGGKDYPVVNFDGAKLKLTDDAYDFAGDKGAYQLIPGGFPSKMDIHGVEGPNAGRTIPAIYQLDGDQLSICYQLGKGDRPGGFKSPEGTKVLLIRYTRVP